MSIFKMLLSAFAGLPVQAMETVPVLSRWSGLFRLPNGGAITPAQMRQDCQARRKAEIAKQRAATTARARTFELAPVATDIDGAKHPSSAMGQSSGVQSSARKASKFQMPEDTTIEFQPPIPFQMAGDEWHAVKTIHVKTQKTIDSDATEKVTVKRGHGVSFARNGDDLKVYWSCPNAQDYRVARLVKFTVTPAQSTGRGPTEFSDQRLVDASDRWPMARGQFDGERKSLESFAAIFSNYVPDITHHADDELSFVCVPDMTMTKDGHKLVAVYHASNPSVGQLTARDFTAAVSFLEKHTDHKRWLSVPSTNFMFENDFSRPTITMTTDGHKVVAVYHAANLLFSTTPTVADVVGEVLGSDTDSRQEASFADPHWVYEIHSGTERGDSPVSVRASHWNKIKKQSSKGSAMHTVPSMSSFLSKFTKNKFTTVIARLGGLANIVADESSGDIIDELRAGMASHVAIEQERLATINKTILNAYQNHGGSADEKAGAAKYALGHLDFNLSGEQRRLAQAAIDSMKSGTAK